MSDTVFPEPDEVIFLLFKQEGQSNLLGMLLDSFRSTDGGGGSANSFPPLRSILLALRHHLKSPTTQTLVCSLLSSVTVRRPSFSLSLSLSL